MMPFTPAFTMRLSEAAGTVEASLEALLSDKAAPGEIARYATEGGVWNVMEPYVSALTHD